MALRCSRFFVNFLPTNQPTTMSNITFQNLLDVLHNTADHLKDAAGEDKIISRKDLREKLQELSGGEQAFLDVFFQFLKELEESDRGRVTTSDVDRGVEMIKEHLLPHYELSPDDLSAGEAEDMSDALPMGLALGVQLKRTAEEENNLSSEEIFNLLNELTPDLFFDYLGSEASEPIEAVQVEVDIRSLTPETFAKALNLDANDPKDKIERFVDAEPFFLVFVEQHAQFGLEEQAAAIAGLMQDQLEQNKIVVLGEDYNPNVPPDHPVYVVGVAEDGQLVGFKSKVIWT